MTIEQRLAEIIRAFCADALSSTINLNVDRHHARRPRPGPARCARLPGYAAAAPDTIQRRFLETPGQINTSGNTITVRLDSPRLLTCPAQSRTATRHHRPLVGNR